MFRRNHSLILLLALLALAAGCAPLPSGYIAAQGLYYSGEPVLAEQALADKAALEVEKDGKLKNLYLWDLATYQFYQGRWSDAKDSFLKSVADKEAINSASEDIGAAMTSSSSSKYVGDPVEVATAYFYIAVCFYKMGDMESSRIALRRCLEEDLSNEADRVGDLVVANYLFGEVSLRMGNVDDAIVAFRRTTDFQENFVPGMVALALLEEDRRPEEAVKLWDQVAALESADYVAKAKESGGSGAVVLAVSGRPSVVKADAVLGSFRTREAVGSGVTGFTVRSEDVVAKASLADSMHDQLTSQGGFKDEVRKQATRAVVKGLFSAIGAKDLGPDTSADLRYWVTLPGRFDLAYVPLPEGSHELSVQATGVGHWNSAYGDAVFAAFNKKRAKDGLPLLTRDSGLSAVEVEDGARTLVVYNSNRPVLQ